MNISPRTATIILHDILVAAMAWLAAYWLRFNLAVPLEFQTAALSTLLWVVPLQAVVFWRFGLYRGILAFCQSARSQAHCAGHRAGGVADPAGPDPVPRQRGGAAFGTDS